MKSHCMVVSMCVDRVCLHTCKDLRRLTKNCQEQQGNE